MDSLQRLRFIVSFGIGLWGVAPSAEAQVDMLYSSPFRAAVAGPDWGDLGTGRIAAADLDGDGLQELVVTRDPAPPAPPLGLELPAVRTAAVLVLAQETASTTPFTLRQVASAPLPIGAEPTDVVALDLDLDGTPEVAVALGQLDEVRVFRVSSAGGLELEQTLSVGREPVRLLPCELDGDGVLDLVVVEKEDDAVRVLLNDGAGVLRSTLVLAAGDEPVDADLGDFDGDGDLDVAITAKQQAAVGVFRNDGDGTLSVGPKLIPSPSFTKIQGSTVLDLDADGLLDIAFVTTANSVNPSQIQWFAGTGTGTFAFRGAIDSVVENGYRGVTAFDFDGDGQDELGLKATGVFGTGVGALIVAEGLLGPAPSYTYLSEAFGSSDLLTVDLQGDGDLDLVDWDDVGVDLRNYGLQALLRLGPGDLLASNTERNGSGVNPTCLQGVDPPALGATASWTYDPTGLPGATVAAFLGASAPLAPLATPFGELLVDPSTTPLLVYSRSLTNCTTCSDYADVPADTTLVGLQVYGQAALIGSSTVQLCNALDLTLGW